MQNNIIKPCVTERKWRNCNVFISSSPCNVFTVMYSCFWQSENEDTVRQSVVNFSKIFLCLFTFDATIFKQFCCHYSSGQYWRILPAMMQLLANDVSQISLISVLSSHSGNNGWYYIQNSLWWKAFTYFW